MQYVLAPNQIVRKTRLSQKRVKEIRVILRQTAGLWQGRKLNPLSYQRAMRASYAGEK